MAQRHLLRARCQTRRHPTRVAALPLDALRSGRSRRQCGQSKADRLDQRPH